MILDVCVYLQCIYSTTTLNLLRIYGVSTMYLQYIYSKSTLHLHTTSALHLQRIENLAGWMPGRCDTSVLSGLSLANLA